MSQSTGGGEEESIGAFSTKRRHYESGGEGREGDIYEKEGESGGKTQEKSETGVKTQWLRNLEKEREQQHGV